MKTFFLSLALAAILTACGSGKPAASLKPIAGEWVIVKVDGNVVAPSENIPFIGFNIADTTVYGSTGCNQITGALNVDASAGKIDFSAIGSTRRMCADMKSEEQVLGALGRVKSFCIAGNGNLQLLDAEQNAVIELELKK